MKKLFFVLFNCYFTLLYSQGIVFDSVALNSISIDGKVIGGKISDINNIYKTTKENDLCIENCNPIMFYHWINDNFYYTSKINKPNLISGFCLSKDSSILVNINDLSFSIGDSLKKNIEILTDKYPNSFYKLYKQYLTYYKLHNKKKVYFTISIKIYDDKNYIYIENNEIFIWDSISIRYKNETVDNICINYYIE